MSVKILTTPEAKEMIANNKELEIINVFATWCGPCQMFAPVLEELSNKITVGKVDLDLNRELANELQVQGVPTTIFLKDGKEVDRVMGFVPQEVIEKKIEAL